MKYLPFLAVVLLMLSGVLRSEATAGAQVVASMVNGTIRSSDLLVKIKHKKKHNKRRLIQPEPEGGQELGRAQGHGCVYLLVTPGDAGTQTGHTGMNPPVGEALRLP